MSCWEASACSKSILGGCRGAPAWRRWGLVIAGAQFFLEVGLHPPRDSVDGCLGWSSSTPLKRLGVGASYPGDHLILGLGTYCPLHTGAAGREWGGVDFPGGGGQWRLPIGKTKPRIL